MRIKGWVTAAVAVVLLTALVMPAMADHVIKIGGQCDRTGPTKNVGVELCPGIHDYIALVNKKGGVLGHKIEHTEIEHGYTVDRGVEAYERLKRHGVVAAFDYGTPIVYALTPRHMDDKIPAITPGFGRADSIDGEAWPYIFPMAASYWSQAGAAMKYIKDNGAKKGTKVAHIYYDNPAGREGIPIMEAVAKKEGYQLRLFAVPPPGVEMGPQVIDITRRFKADWVVGHLFGQSPSVSIKELKRAGFPGAHDRQPERPRGGRLGEDVPGQGHGVGARHRLGAGLPRGSHGHGEAGQQEVAAHASTQQRRGRLRPGHPGPQGDLARCAGAADHHPARVQRGRQEHDAQGHLRPPQARAGGDHQVLGRG